ncbi:uncharacterized protein LOC130450428 [Diorhabda sublineata]|uniref:uncharacterized protein LOC130450428 n=1 Tax=Diorhabda sublineata TaxID=1163346 RepID=UPI0024E16B97|nr:uncharacterized protein LOC130450428 [Diorhabda sublineata]
MILLAEKLAKVQRLAAIGITGAQRSTTQAAQDVLLNLKPLDLHIKGLAAKSALRLRETGLWKQSNYGHTRILREIENMADTVDKGVLEQCTDYTTAKLTFDIDLNILIPTREDWEENPGTAELRAIERAADLIRCRDEAVRDITIYTNSQAILILLSSTTVRSRSVVSCNKALSWIRDRKVRLCWIPGHSNVEGKQLADKLAKLGTTRSGDKAVGLPLPPIKLLRDAIDRTLEGELGKRWSNRDDCVISRSLWPVLQKKKTTELLGYGKASIRRVVAVITGHCTVGSRLRKMGIRTNDLCAECIEEEEVIEHLMCHCTALASKRLQCMGSETLECLEETADLNHFIANRRREQGPGNGRDREG